MKRLCKTLLLLAALLCSAQAAEKLYDLPTSGFRMTLDKFGNIRVWYLELPLVTGCAFQVASKQWVNQLPGSNPKWKTANTRTEQGRQLSFSRDLQEKGKCATTIQLAPTKLRISNEFSLTPATNGMYCYSECFLARDTFADREFKTDNGKNGVLKVGKGTIYTQGLHQLELPTEFGKLTIKVSEAYKVAGADTKQSWEFRSVCDRAWGAKDRRTFSLMNVHTMATPHTASGKTEYEFTFEPCDDIMEKILAHRTQQVLLREQKMAELKNRESDRQARIKANGGVVLYPTPQNYQRMPGEFPLSDKTVIVVPDKMTKEQQRAPKRLREDLMEYRGIALEIVPESKWGKQGTAILIGTTGAKKTLAEKLPKHDEAFCLSMTPERIFLASTDAAGAWYGVQALLQLPRWQGKDLVMPCIQVEDWPDFKTRAMTLTLGQSKQMPFLRHTIRHVLPRQRVNMIFVGGASLGRIRWASHPEVGSQTAFSPEQIRELADLARENFIEPVPHIQGFGHTGGLVRTRRDLLVPKEAGSCFDISRDDVRDYIFDLYADAIDAFQPKRYFHVGFDEARGLDAICGDRSPAEVVAEHITKVNDWLQKRGLRMIMWADMLLDHETYLHCSAANSQAPHYSNVNTAAALPMIPKSVILANWYYGTAEQHPQIEHLQKNGFELFPTTWYRPENNFRFLKNAKEAGLDWAAGSSWMYCGATNPTMMGSLLGEYAWTAGHPTLEKLNYDELALFYDLLQKPRISDRSHRQQMVDLTAVANRDLRDQIPDDGVGWLDLGAWRDLAALKPGILKSNAYNRDFTFTIAGESSARCVLVKGKKFDLKNVPNTATVPLAKRADGLVFLHTGTADNYHMSSAGNYQIVYEDGSSETFALRNSLNIAGWLKPTSYGSWKTARQQSYCRGATLGWRGLTLDERTVELSLTEWRNPKPQLAIREIRLNAPDNAALALVGLTALQTTP